MWSRSSRFDVAVTDSHEVVIDVSLWSPGMRQLLAADLAVVGGSVTASRTATRRRSCSVDLVDDTGRLGEIFSSRRTVPPVELVVTRGIRYPDGTVETIPLGVFPVSEIKATRREYSLTAPDRSRRVSRHRLVDPRVYPVGTGYAWAAGDIAYSRFTPAGPTLVETSSSDATPTPIVLVETDDLWEVAEKLAGSAGCEIYYDQVGRAVVRDVADTVGADVAWTFADGENSTLLDDTHLAISDEPGYNGVLVVGEGSGGVTQPPRFLAIDSDPSSSTYWWAGDDGYGRVPEVVTDPAAATGERAELIARARLRHWLGRNDSMGLATIPHPAVEPGDFVRVQWDGLDQVMIVDSVSIPLDVETAATVSVRSQVQREAA